MRRSVVALALALALGSEAAADARLSRGGTPPSVRYPWRRLLARGARSGDAVELRLSLLPGAGA